MSENNTTIHQNVKSYTIGKITYLIKSQSSENATQTLKEKIDGLIDKDAAKTAK